jgi:hypothetical protein
MGQNKTGKYFKYAIGEIVLVVIGILIALSINNWNEERKNRKLENTYLKNVHIEFEANKIKFEKTLNIFDKQYELADSISRKVFPITDNNWSEIIKIYEKAFYPESFDPSKSSISVLINSGKIDLVQNDSLKQLLSFWNDQFEDYKEEENDLSEWWRVFNEIYLNEPTYSKWESDVTSPISNELKVKLEKLMWKRRFSLGIVTSKWKINQESKELMDLIDSIILLTRTYAN